MKYNQLFAELTAAGCSVHRHGANHDIWFSPLTGNRFPLPRHGGQEVPKGMERRNARQERFFWGSNPPAFLFS